MVSTDGFVDFSKQNITLKLRTFSKKFLGKVLFSYIQKKTYTNFRGWSTKKIRIAKWLTK